MEKKAIIAKIEENYQSLPSECLLELEKRSTIAHFEKGSTLVREGEYADQMYFVDSGSLRAYYLKEGKDISDWFAFEGQFVCSIRSFFLDIPSEHYIEALENTTVLVVRKQDIAALSYTYRAFEQVGAMAMTQTMLSLQERIVSIQFKSAKERYDTLLAAFPGIEQRVSLTHIASYLGVTLETVSRIRSK